MRISSIVIGAVAAVFLCGSAIANEFAAPITKLADTQVREWIKDPILINAVKAQNAKHANMTQADINKLDKQWMAETGEAAGIVLNEAEGLSKQSAALRGEVDNFLGEIRAS